MLIIIFFSLVRSLYVFVLFLLYFLVWTHFFFFILFMKIIIQMLLVVLLIVKYKNILEFFIHINYLFCCFFFFLNFVVVVWLINNFLSLNFLCEEMRLEILISSSCQTLLIIFQLLLNKYIIMRLNNNC